MSTLCEHYVSPLYVWALCVTIICVSTLCVSTMCEHHVWLLCVSTLCVSTMCEHSMCEHYVWGRYVCVSIYVWALYVWALYVWAPYVWALHVWAPYVWAPPKPKEENTKKKFLGRVLGPADEKCENYPEKWTSKKLKRHPRTPKSTRSTTKNEHRRSWRADKVRELPRETRFGPFSDPFQTIAEYRKVRELPQKMNIEEVQEPETTKLYIQKPFTPGAPSPKVRKFTDKTNMQARNHENSDGFSLFGEKLWLACACRAVAARWWCTATVVQNAVPTRHGTTNWQDTLAQKPSWNSCC